MRKWHCGSLSRKFPFCVTATGKTWFHGSCWQKFAARQCKKGLLDCVTTLVFNFAFCLYALVTVQLTISACRLLEYTRKEAWRLWWATLFSRSIVRCFRGIVASNIWSVFHFLLWCEDLVTRWECVVWSPCIKHSRFVHIDCAHTRSYANAWNQCFALGHSQTVFFQCLKSLFLGSFIMNHKCGKINAVDI